MLASEHLVPQDTKDIKIGKYKGCFLIPFLFLKIRNDRYLHIFKKKKNLGLRKAVISGVTSPLISSSMHAQLYPILCDPMDCSPPGTSVHGISQARILE